ncbi:hypothetical protein DFJ58DRAFT_779634 [Suillus subalutaceus]|uniref:uncharacterized protein n=1 Tax=Suillus subalutaceus TaxID=48586 RepID=UPI001B87D1DE|nr:uncharacterized protein DFJ58DRAFT_779634 [Suillus subalutaceus]KAG1860149.1 hypothetical protein DFJ58DRAFT_779634 [Suillus subalutaceus]
MSAYNHPSTSRSPDLSRTLPLSGPSRTSSVQPLGSGESLRCNARSPLLPQYHAQRDMNGKLTASSSRASRQPTLPPASDSTFNTSPFPAISHKPTHYINQHVLDPPLVNRSLFSHQPGPSQSPGHHVSHNFLESSQLSSSSSTRHVAINSNSTRQTTSTPVFNNISDLAAHYGIPQSLPSAPRTTPSRPEPGEPSSTLSVESFGPTNSPDFANLCSNYLNMLSQKIDNNDATVVHGEDTALWTATPSDAEAILTVMDVSRCDLNEYLTSPIIDSPFDDELLTTPAFGSADINADILTSPLLDDFGGDSFGELPSLFGDFGTIYPPSKPTESYHIPEPNFDALYQMSPDTPFESPLESPANRPPQRKVAVTGTRKNITPEALVPVDAPTQQRKYLTPSATSRKEARAVAFGEEQDELTEDVHISPSMTEQEQIEAKRRQNTIAARRSRKRKLEYQRELEESVEQYKRESEIWKSKAMTYQALLRSHNIEYPELPDP